MNAQLTPPPSTPPLPAQSLPSQPPDPLTLLAPTSARVPRTSVIDRAAMRVGLWLVLWGSRPVTTVEALERHRHRLHLAAERERREASAALATRLWMHGA